MVRKANVCALVIIRERIRTRERDKKKVKEITGEKERDKKIDLIKGEK